MSYSFSVTNVKTEDVESALTTAFDSYQKNLASGDYELDAAAKEQGTAAIAVAKSLVDSGTVGGSVFNVTVSGHANPDHKPRSGWANDALTVAVSSAETYVAPQA